MRAAFAPKIFFNFREIVEVVESFHEGREAGQVLVRSWSGRCQVLGRSVEIFFGATPAPLPRSWALGWLRSQMMRRPSSVRYSSTVSMWREAPPIRLA